MKDARKIEVPEGESGLAVAPPHFSTAPSSRGGVRAVVSGQRRLAKDWLAMAIAPDEMRMAEAVATTRVQPLREFDQIAMRAGDLLRQVKLIAPYLAGKRVAFVGDNDGASRLIGLLGVRGHIPLPASLTLLDFDERIVELTQSFAEEHGFGHLLHSRLYNVFDPVPEELEESHDWFYTNPPYGAHNNGKSVLLFVGRGVEFCRAGRGHGCIIIPDARRRPWSEVAMWNTQKLLLDHGWMVDEKLNEMHAYHLDDDSELTSCLLSVRSARVPKPKRTPYQGRRVALGEISRFYGRRVLPPYPRYIRANGTFDYSWT